MPQHCAVVGCAATSSKHRGLSFFQLKRPDNEWTDKLVRAVNRADKSFNPNKAFICSRHFDTACFTIQGEGDDLFSRKTLNDGSVPTLHMPERSCQSRQITPRKSPTNRFLQPVPTDTEPLPTNEAESMPSKMTMDYAKETIANYPGWYLCPLGNDLSYDIFQYKNTKVSMCIQVKDGQIIKTMLAGMPVELELRNDLNDTIKTLCNIVPCNGVTGQGLIDVAGGQGHYVESLFKENTLHQAVRSLKCSGVSDHSLCGQCSVLKSVLKKRAQRKTLNKGKILKSKAPLGRVATSRLKTTLQTQRKREKKLEIKLKKIQEEISKGSLPVQSGLHESLVSIMEKNEKAVDQTLPKLFWQQQLKALNTQTSGHRWHPMMVRLAILLHSQSPHAYRTLRDSGVVTLPGETTLRDYTNYICPSQGFQHEVIQELREQVAKFTDNERWVALMHDEMQISSGLVYNERAGEVVGFTLNSESTKASHVLVFMVVGLTSPVPLKFPIGYFGTTGATSSQLHPLFWEAVYHVEQCGLKVISSTSDKASPNMKLYNIIAEDGYSCVNIFAPVRSLFCCSDVPHSVKTTRTCLRNSGSGLNSRFMWNQGKHLLWQHVVDLYNLDKQSELKLTKLTPSHIDLTPQSTMKVNLAAQVLSSSVSKAMLHYLPEDTHETARFIGLMDRFFDCLNVRSYTEGIRRRKPDLLPYTSLDDARFHFLEHEFLGYLRDWKAAIDAREGYNNVEKAKMFLSHQTYKGLVMTVHSLVAATKFLLQNGVKEVYTNLFCQDPLEQYFGYHRGLGRRSDNPTLYTFGYQSNKLRMQHQMLQLLKPKGNITVRRTHIPVVISDEPLKKRKR